MAKETLGRITEVKKQWWLKVNTKSIRFGPPDGAAFPHIIKVEYTVDGTVYTRRKWLTAGYNPPLVGTEVTVSYAAEKPAKGTIRI